MNYELLYKKLIKTLKNELSVTKKYDKNLSYNRDELVDKIENQGMILHLNWLFKECLPELEGKKWNNIFFNESEWEEWKKEIKNKG